MGAGNHRIASEVAGVFCFIKKTKGEKMIFLFDLDGTLLPMDNDAFTKGYFNLLAKKLAPLGYDAQELVDAVWAGTAAMVRNDGTRSNEEAFWERFEQIYGARARADRPVFEEFYRNEFQGAQSLSSCDPRAAKAVRMAKENGHRVVLATNPLFPAVATESRIRWAGLEPENFELYTTYENIGYCKPNPDYYRELVRLLGVEPSACVMVGNDVDEDMVAETLGMRVFLLTDHLINREEQDISRYPHGGFDELLTYIEKVS